MVRTLPHMNWEGDEGENVLMLLLAGGIMI